MVLSVLPAELEGLIVLVWSVLLQELEDSIVLVFSVLPKEVFKILDDVAILLELELLDLLI